MTQKEREILVDAYDAIKPYAGQRLTPDIKEKMKSAIEGVLRRHDAAPSMLAACKVDVWLDADEVLRATIHKAWRLSVADTLA